MLYFSLVVPAICNLFFFHTRCVLYDDDLSPALNTDTVKDVLMLLEINARTVDVHSNMTLRSTSYCRRG